MIGLQVKDGVVVNAAVFKELPEGWVDVQPGVGIGWIDNGDGTFSPPATEAIPESEIIKQAERRAKLTGIEFENVMCSATRDDMTGLSAVENYILAGNDVNFEFSNGNKLLLTLTNLDGFRAVWILFRASFF